MSVDRFNNEYKDDCIPIRECERRVNITELRDKVIIIEEKLNHYSELYKEEIKLNREQMSEVQVSLNIIEEQTAKWSNVFWGITIGITAIFGIISWILSMFSIDIKTILQGIR